MKIAVFWEKRFENNNFYNLNIDKNLSPFSEMVQINGNENTISMDLLESRGDKNEFVIFCFLTLSIFSICEYLRIFLKYPKNKKYFFLFEPVVVAPIGHWKMIHVFFDKVYTWDDSIVDNKKYFKFIWPQSHNGIIDFIPFTQKKGIVLMNANKFSFGKNELYSLREKVIRYFETQKTAFDLYGPGWGRPNLKQRIFGFMPYSSWKGRADNKIVTISQYKFNICFENMSDTPGYITEKIWDSFKAKTVPIYWGASNIEEYIPKSCFIDYRDYRDFERLHIFLLGMSEEQYNQYIKNIESFLLTKDAKKWFDKDWAKDFLKPLN